MTTLSHEQRRLMDIHLRTNTLYGGANTGSREDRLHIINSIDYAMGIHNTFLSVDLFLPNCFIIQRDINEFWFKMALIITPLIENWHALEYGRALNNVDRKERYVYTWSGDDNVHKFYTKILHDGYQHKELIWYFGKSSLLLNLEHSNEEDTESDEINLHSN